MFLCLILTLQAADTLAAQAAEGVSRALNPVGEIRLTVPDSMPGGNYFFIRENDHSVSELSREKLYIPIQRSGDLDSEAEVTLKVVDLSAKHDVNYTVEMYKDPIQPEIILDDISILDHSERRRAGGI